MFASASPGAGKTTVSRGLVEALQARGYDSVWVPDSCIFDWPQLADLARAFRAREYPGPGSLLGGLERVLAAVDGSDWVVFETNWLLGAEDLPWAQSSWNDLVDFAREALRLCSGRSELTVIFLDLGLEEALVRQRRRDGDAAFRNWLDYMRSLPALGLDPYSAPIQVVRAWASRLADLWAAAGQPLVRLSADGTPGQVLDRVLDIFDLS